jgi:hypothetical protein
MNTGDEVRDNQHTAAVIELGTSGSHSPAEPKRRRLTPQEALAYNREPLRLLELDEAERAEVIAEIQRWADQQTEEQAAWFMRRAPGINPVQIAGTLVKGQPR